MGSLFDTADAADSSPPELDSLFDSLSSLEDDNFDSTQQLINDAKEDIIEDEPYVYEDPNDTKRTISMTVLFLVLMVLYVGFCFYYRKVKVRQSVGDYNESEHRREQRRRENQVSYFCVCLFNFISSYSYSRKGRFCDICYVHSC